MTISLLIATYNSPQFLQLCLQSVLRQNVMPDEILIADDGSKDDTRMLIDSMKPQFSIPVLHVWHEDKGFRLAAIRNKAIKASSCDYIVQIDGDIILDPHFIEDERANAERGFFCTGSRAMVSKERTERAVEEGVFFPCWYSAGIYHRLNAIRLTLLSHFFHDYKRVNGCHMAFWKSDLFAVNGYDEDIIGWGCEDNDITDRLCRMGVGKKHLKFSAIQYHLWHKENSHSTLLSHKELLKKNAQNNIIKCSNGIEDLRS